MIFTQMNQIDHGQVKDQCLSRVVFSHTTPNSRLSTELRKEIDNIWMAGAGITKTELESCNEELVKENERLTAIISEALRMNHEGTNKQNEYEDRV